MSRALTTALSAAQPVSNIEAAVPASPPAVIAILPRGEAYRNFVYTGALDRVNAQVGVGVLAVFPNHALERDLRERYLGVWELRPSPERWPVRLLREVLDVAHAKWLWSEAAKERWRRRDQEVATLGQGLKRLGKKALAFPFSSTRGLLNLSRVERAASRFLRTTDEYLNWFRARPPQLVFNTSHVHSAVATQAVQAAQWLGIPTATFVFSWDNLTSQGRILTPYDYYLVWNQALADQLLAVYPTIRRQQILVTGTPQFDFHFQSQYHWSRQDFCTRVGADPSRPIVLYTTGMPNHMPGEPAIVREIADLLSSLPGQPQLLVRIYPKDSTDRFRQLQRQRPDILFPAVPWEKHWLTPLPADIPLLTNTLRHADVGINVASTVSLELCMFNKPVINVAYNPPDVPVHELSYARYYEFDHYRPVVETGAVNVVRHPRAMADAVREALAYPQRRASERRRLVMDLFGGLLDGHRAEAVATALVALARRGTPVPRTDEPRAHHHPNHPPV